MLFISCEENNNNESIQYTDTIKPKDLMPKNLLLRTKLKTDADFLVEGKDITKVSLLYNDSSYFLFKEKGSYEPIDFNEIFVSKFMPDNSQKIQISFFESLVRTIYIVEENDSIYTYKLYFDEAIDSLAITELNKIPVLKK